MVWIILTFAFGWLLCGAWAKGMAEKRTSGQFAKDFALIFHITGPIALAMEWLLIWPARLWRFCKGVAKAWREAKD